ncbi:MAG: CotS family spore coat protein [Bacillota bacterium]|nr:CotS family spore coat protein [Bacillota bacterium]
METQALLAHWNLTVKSAEPVSGSPRVHRVETAAGPKVLKRSRIREDEVLFVHAAQEHLAASGFHEAPRFQLARDGRPFVRQGSELWTLTDWVDAERSTLRRKNQLDLAVGKVAELHERSAGFPAPAQPADRTRWGAWPEIFRARLDQLGVFRRLAREARTRTAFDRLYMGLLDYHWEQAATAITLLLRTRYRRLMDLECRRASICHHDLTHNNIMFRPDGSVHLLDLDYCLADSRLHDVGSMILRHCKRFGWDLAAAELYIKLYSRNSRDPLSSDELAVLAAFLYWPQDFWQVGLQYYVEKQPWPLSRFLSSLERKTANRREHEAFLAGFRRRFSPDLTV